MFSDMTRELPSIGWAGFLDTDALTQSFLALILATFLGAVIAFHPTTARTVDTRAEAELPKVLIMYALVGAVVGEIVLEYGMVVGFVIFGLGGLMRFRTDAASTRDTGRLIMVTLIGLISGLNLPHFAVMATVFAWIANRSNAVYPDEYRGEIEAIIEAWRPEVWARSKGSAVADSPASA